MFEEPFDLDKPPKESDTEPLRIRDYIAGCFIQGLMLRHGEPEYSDGDVIHEALALANEYMKAR